LFIEAVQEGQPHPILFAVDQEGGFVARIPGDRLPSARELGTGDTGVTTETFRARQELVLQTGANVNLGVVADVSPGSRAYIHNRTFSGDPVIVTDHVGAALEGAVPGVAQTLKHFPGHGMVFEDSHQEIPETTLTLEQWRNTHALPFIAGVSGGVELVMTAHIRVLTVSKDPASLSDDWINILRAELGYQGVIITDDLSMLANSGEEAYQDPAATAVAALVAGNDLIMVMVDPADRPGYFTYDRIIDALVAAVVSGEISEEQVDASLLRVLALRDSLAIR
jgi:beta-N-acetylhexosaminidase